MLGCRSVPRRVSVGSGRLVGVGVPGVAGGADGARHSGRVLRRSGDRQDVPPVDVPYPDPALVRADIRDGVPVDPDSYDYRRAALDALLFPRLLDRFWQNLRRCAGYKVQYFSAIEAQRRLVPHLHAAVRGAIPRATLKAVVRATYYAAWWPSIDQVVYDGDRVPLWDRESGQYVDPDTGEVLPTWEQAVDQLDEPVHVVSFGTQLDIKGILGGSADSARAVRYLCKYLTKTIAATYATTDSDADWEPAIRESDVERHIERLHEHIRVLPCSPACANWLRYGAQPANPGPGLVPGRCPSPAHDRENLGLGGRRVLVSRAWTGKTLTEHRADRRDVVAQVLEAADVPTEDAARMATTHTMPDGRARYVWKDVPAGELDYVSIMIGCIRHARNRREQYETAKAQLGRHEPPGEVAVALWTTVRQQAPRRRKEARTAWPRQPRHRASRAHCTRDDT